VLSYRKSQNWSAVSVSVFAIVASKVSLWGLMLL